MGTQPKKRHFQSQGSPLAYVTSWRSSVQGQLLSVVLVNIDSSSSDQSVAFASRVVDRASKQVLGVKAPSVWLFPGGFLGNGVRRSAGIRALERASDLLPPSATLVAGLDYEGEQHAIVLRRGAVLVDAKRWESPMADRTFGVGKANAAVFVCGEFVGSETSENGPYTADEYVNARCLKDYGVGLALCLSHDYVPRCRGIAPMPRRPHQRQMQALAGSSIAVALSHHHENRQTLAGTTDMTELSDWFLDAGRRLFSPGEVTVVEDRG